MLSYSGPKTKAGQTVKDIYNSGYECGAAESGNSPSSSLGEKKEEVEDKIWNKEENGYGETAREYRARRKTSLELRMKGGEGGRRRKEKGSARALVPFGDPSASERPVISFYIHPARFESLLSRFQLPYLSLAALTLCWGLRDRISSS